MNKFSLIFLMNDVIFKIFPSIFCLKNKIKQRN